MQTDPIRGVNRIVRRSVRLLRSGSLEREGAFLLSINDTPGMRRTFAALHIDEVRLRYSVARRGTTPEARALIVPNREARPALL